MVTPVTGPTVTEVMDNTHYSYRKTYRQAKPIDRPLPYVARRGVISSKTGDGPSPDVVATYGLWHTSIPQDWEWAWNVCYEKLKGKISDRASMGVTLAEIGQSIEMIERRAVDTYRIVRKLVRFDFLGAAEALNNAFKGDQKRAKNPFTVPAGVSRSKSFANNYLEFHFGMAPLYADIHSAIQVLNEPIKSPDVKSVVRIGQKVLKLEPDYVYSSPSPDGHPLYVNSKHYRIAQGGVSMGCQVRVDNPNLWLANQLGLVNPLIIGVELIPFSFVADWFFNMSQFLSRGSDFYGLAIENAWHSIRELGYYRKHHVVTDWYWAVPGPIWIRGTYSEVNSTTGSYSFLERKTGLVYPTFMARPWQPWGWRRAASAVALLTQQLSRLK